MTRRTDRAPAALTADQIAAEIDYQVDRARSWTRDRGRAERALDLLDEALEALEFGGLALAEDRLSRAIMVLDGADRALVREAERRWRRDRRSVRAHLPRCTRPAHAPARRAPRRRRPQRRARAGPAAAGDDGPPGPRPHPLARGAA